MRGRPPEALLFDIGGVLLFPDGRRIADELTSLLGVRLDPSRCGEAIFRLAAATGRDGFPLILDSAQRAEAWAGFAGVPADRAVAAWDRVAALEVSDPPLWNVLHPEAVAVLESCREQGLRLGAVSNTGAPLRTELAHAGLADYFDALAESWHLQLAKPDPRLFDLALTQLDLPAAATMYVGDTYFFDVIGGLAAGIPSPVLFDPLDLYGEADRCHRIRELSALPKVVRQRLRGFQPVS